MMGMMATVAPNSPTANGIPIAALSELSTRPEPWAPGEPRFWDDPHIAVQMLKAHLDPSVAAASAPPETIDGTVGWLIDRLGLGPGTSLVDFGCGPGLYTRRLAARGLRVTGIDLSINSIEHARAHDPSSDYLCMSYLDFDGSRSFDVVTLIYGDYCTFSDGDRATLLDRVRRSLVPGGWFVFDVSTRAHHEASNCGNGWSAHPEGGFWRPGPHLVLARNYWYDDLDMALDQYVTLEPGGDVRVYRNWFRYFDAETITEELEEGGFSVRGLYSDLKGSPLDSGGQWIGVVARLEPSGDAAGSIG